MNPGDAVYIKLNDSWHRYVYQIGHEFKDSCTIRNGVSEYICRKSELITEVAYLRMVREQQLAEARQRLSNVINAWQGGKRTAAEMLDTVPARSKRHLAQMIVAAKHYGFITPDKPLAGSESTPPYVEGTSEDPRASVTPDGTVRMD